MRILSRKRIMSADPGLKGALCFCDVVQIDGGQYALGNVRIHKMPVDTLTDGKNMPSAKKLMQIIEDEGGVEVAIIEKLQQRPGMANMFRLGLNYGILIACAYQNVSSDDLILVAPDRWKKAVGVTKDKMTSIAMANELLKISDPKGNMFFEKNQDGEAEAYLIAHYYAQNVINDFQSA